MGTEKVYTSREEVLNVASHALGALAALAGSWIIFHCRRVQSDPLALAAGIFYLGTLVFMFGCSSLYHLVKDQKRKQVMRKLDHCAIYFLIAGSYAPVLYTASKDVTGAVIFGILLLLSATGSIGKFIAGHKFHKLEVALYIVMGWCAVFIAKKVIRELPPVSLWLLLSGGIAYTAGVAAYVSRKEFSHAVWHIFVSCGAALQFFAISRALDL